ncbi:MAG: hypothetical protein EOO61_06575 [Hymenobacter sp.]|nr:MAG: hypothetical protein EOO61_06575 [Hymenobacter sp.]
MPKISIFVFLLELFRGTGMFGYGSFIAASTLSNSGLADVGTNLLLVCAFLSLVIGTVVGLGQYRLKRLFAYSTISHVGFLLLALAISSEESVDAFLFKATICLLNYLTRRIPSTSTSYLIRRISRRIPILHRTILTN